MYPLVPSLTVLLAAASAAAAILEMPWNRPCGTDAPPADLVTLHQKLSRKKGMARRGAYPTIDVDVRVHVIYSGQSTGKSSEHLVSNSMIQRQMAVLNEGFNATGFVFHFKGADWTYNETLTRGHHTLQFVKSLPPGGEDCLHVYMVEQVFAEDSRVAGYAPFPYRIVGTRARVVFIAIGTVPGAARPWYSRNLGRSLIHEAGHSLGLLHLHDGRDCLGDGDYVHDTPSQRAPTYLCNTKVDTCEGEPELKAGSNYMDVLHESVGPLTPTWQAKGSG
ncbi:hypothetical protein DCS_07191 [Drechmeria coniospora]|uniref:Peptidase M43 pregnancy-associated plasma-A domain-containing protein n=1 Tax=Drechmeria coniospora TaxID=98403 RepID=A0A151GDQ4_DRECN|nr:hypothetical protein DCS_07191 [Drechmeria coniospora]KYK55229.1 hypothetical protein DCS_07191 [Drechmeria coniospora]ODA82150.1 hypothetical protein RJ55_00656 [Drechmeria coniospora]